MNLVKILLLVFTACLLGACGRSSTSVATRHYQLAGEIKALDAQHQTATVDGAAVPNFMEAMTMDYPIKSKSDFEALRVGEKITATIDVTDDDRYSLSNIKRQ